VLCCLPDLKHKLHNTHSHVFTPGGSILLQRHWQSMTDEKAMASATTSSGVRGGGNDLLDFNASAHLLRPPRTHSVVPLK
jgi:hypothetical protein